MCIGGCQVYGMIELKRSAGHFHVAPHKDIHSSGVNLGFITLLDLISFTFEQFNITHTINSLSFGDTFPGVHNPLDGEQRVVEDTHGMYQYYLKVVPTRYLSPGCTDIPDISDPRKEKDSRKKNRCKKEIESNQFAGILPPLVLLFRCKW